MNYLQLWIIFSVLCVTLDRAVSLRILGLFPYQGKSHYFVFKPYLEELARRGHDVTVVSHFPDPTTSFKDISLAGTVTILEEAIPLDRSYATIISILDTVITAAPDNCEKMLSLEEVQTLWKRKQKFDLVVTEQFTGDCTLGVAYKLGAPVVALSSLVLMPHQADRLGVPDNVGFVPSILFSGGSRPTFFQRIEAVLFRFYLNTMFKFVSQRADQITLEKHFGPIPDLEELAKEVKFTLLYQYFVLTGSRLLPPNVVEVGGYHVAPAKQLPEDLKKYIEDSPHGVVYVSFGSLVKTSSISADRLAVIIGALSSLQQRVIWKWDNDTLPGAPANILPRRWLPQNDILAHPNVVAFYSHGGMLSTTEAIHHAVPMVVMPVLGDQPANAASVRESGLGVQLDIADLTTESLRSALHTVLQPEFRARVRELSRAWHDRPLSPMDTAVFWSEFAARHSARSFTAHSVGVPLYRYYSLDLLAAALLPPLLLLLAAVKLCGKRAGTTAAAHAHNKPKKE